jgi:hypothetical protein
MWHRVVLVRTDASEESVAIIRVERIGELGTADYFLHDDKGYTFFRSVGS